jgi:hypothetical protein
MPWEGYLDHIVCPLLFFRLVSMEGPFLVQQEHWFAAREDKRGTSHSTVLARMTSRRGYSAKQQYQHQKQQESSEVWLLRVDLLCSFAPRSRSRVDNFCL